MDLRKKADIYGGIPLFILLIIYFSLNLKGFVENLLLVFSVTGLVVDIYLSFFI